MSLEPARVRTLRRQSIRPLTSNDIAAVAAVLERVFRSDRSASPDRLADYVRRMCLDPPGYDPEIPSLVYEDAQGRIGGFLRVSVQRMIFDGRPIRMACSGPFATLPEARAKGAGVFLLRHFLGGPQDLSITDGANDQGRYLWEQLGGQTAHLHSLGWIRLLRPAAFASQYIGRKHPALRPVVSMSRPLSVLLDGAARSLLKNGMLRPARSTEKLVEEDLAPEAMAAAWPRLSARWRLHPDYGKSYLAWLLDEMSSVTSRGPLIGRQVRDSNGKLSGWYLYYLSPSRIAEVMQIVADENNENEIFASLLLDADRRGATAVQGRLEAWLIDPLYRNRCRSYHRAPTLALVHARRSEVTAAVHAGQAFLTRADGEWWTGFREQF
jgi:GNAT superfamily N-acetyltransferase